MRYLVPRRANGLNLISDFDRVVSDFFNDTPLFTASSRTPAVDIREEADRYVLDAELPGMTEKDIDVKVEENLLTISSKHEEQKEEKNEGFVLRERRASSFSRSFVLPSDVDKDKIEAVFKNGLLSLTINKKPEAKPRSIRIKSE